MTSSKLTSCNGYISRRKLNLRFVTTLQTGITDLKKVCKPISRNIGIIVPRLLSLSSNHLIFFSYIIINFIMTFSCIKFIFGMIILIGSN